ncbi:MAG TPA: aminotransferase class I/II-fold pyridoxal phosphate-dependent enzyme [Thermoanaerobaculia bacterium]|nr:aminotransferase class I/II-fold pyridoxal phosphate-dependent enzyme [Thermoanaerobaculia bacterium]
MTADPAGLVRPELRRLGAYHLDRTPCRHKLDQNESPFELPRRLKQAAAAGLLAAKWGRYPDFHADDLRRDLGALHGWPWQGVLVGNGANELLDLCLAALGGPGREILGAEPSFGLYRGFVLKSGGMPRFLPPRPDLRLPIAELENAVAENPRRPLLLCSPNNPTGDAMPPERLERLLGMLAGPLLLDNAYGEFCRHDYRPLLDRHPHLVLLRTFSKAWSLAGIRLGYLLADPRLVAELLKVKLPYNLGHATALAGRAALGAAAAARRRIAVIVARRPQWAEMLASHGLEVFPSEANFLLVRCPSPAAAQALNSGLAEHGIRVRDVGSYPGLAGCLRVSVGNGAALRATRQALSELLRQAGQEGQAEPGAAARPGGIAAQPAWTAEATRVDSAALQPVPDAGQEAPSALSPPPAPSETDAGGGASRTASGQTLPESAAAGLAARAGSIARSTAETRVRLDLSLGAGRHRIDVPDGFFAHMLEALAVHGGFGLEITASGDTHVDLHHTVEDVGIAFGEALAAALGERRGIVRFGTAYAPLDEALARAVVDLSGRGFFAYAAPPAVAAGWVTVDFPLSLVADFFQAVADRGRLTLHLEVLAARNGHHAAEAAFKAVALALRQAVALRAGAAEVPSTKGTLSA